MNHQATIPQSQDPCTHAQCQIIYKPNEFKPVAGKEKLTHTTLFYNET